jgi:hypothetical protein
MTRQFGSPLAFKSAIESRLRKRADELGAPFASLQLKFAIERILARLFRIDPPPWLLKGGFAMDLRFRPRARTTKDIDLAMVHAGRSHGPLSASLRERIQEAAAVDLGDHLTYRIGAPKRELTNAPGGGARFPCEAVLGGKTYAKFHLDVGAGDAILPDPDRLAGDDLLAFAGIETPFVLAIPVEQQFAEKVHAYTFPWTDRINTRTKDLVDLVLLIERGGPVANRARRDIRDPEDPSAAGRVGSAARRVGGGLRRNGRRSRTFDE